ncbi:MAG: FmdB family transcriptional regulator [Actinomycetota bacterium]|nr:FmdB family transcriptional regulator [Actinomycetota bacterium]
MPTYEYVCRDCGEHLEVVQSFRDDPLTVCPACEGRLRKVFAAAGIVFKGSGWHVKDYAQKRTKSSRDGEATSDSATTPDSGGDGAEKKPAAAGATGSAAEKKSA